MQTRKEKLQFIVTNTVRRKKATSYFCFHVLASIERERREREKKKKKEEKWAREIQAAIFLSLYFHLYMK